MKVYRVKLIERSGLEHKFESASAEEVFVFIDKFRMRDGKLMTFIHLRQIYDLIIDTIP